MCDHWEEAKEQRLRAHRAYGEQRRLRAELDALRDSIARLADEWAERYDGHSVSRELRALLGEL